MMIVRHVGPKVDEDKIRLFTRSTGISVPKSYGEFLCNVANGGSPVRPCWCLVESLDGYSRGPAKLHGLLGIDHPDKNFDLETLSAEPKDCLYGRVFRFGYDEGGNHFCIKTKVEPIGEVCWMPFSECEDNPKDTPLRVAASFDEFISALLDVEPQPEI